MSYTITRNCLTVGAIGLRVANPDQVQTLQTFQDNLYVEGVLIDNDGNLINGTTLLVYMATGKPVVINDAPYQLTDGSYSAWTTKNPTEVGVLFSAKGYKARKISFAALLEAPDVILRKEDPIPWWAIALVIAAIAIYAKQKGGKVSGFNSGDVMAIFLIVGGIIAFGLVEKILKGLGLWGGKNVTDEAADPNSAWKPTYWQQFDTYTFAFTEQQARDFSYTIHNAFSLFQDDWNAIQGVFSQMRTKANVSFLAWVFQKKYGEDLLSFLTNGGGILPWDGLSTAHMDTLINLVKSLPKN